ncbi:low molecular weight protein-tyrosine-phosphatase [Sunxiuqinia dokdonensis]|uniref:Phosphotyrosine protein phosphatase n=1 Tax=Sunxiuqinia dokdonensis TaxID=1409788 RepID=A0A0L8VCB7_9BACT|nr:low molecular weight protein-tyrosine-phosphatase [Sunxiuqinia dokdonensis]KOH46120.1 phosphotyrosine protein phosphatase [Sunxiuqinia dokdonensis]
MKKRVLFVCLGNICRSPSAEAVFNSLLEEQGLENEVECDSAGTAAYHEGEPADGRMQSHAIRRGYRLTSISRPLDPIHDFDTFDYVIGMDDNNVWDLKKKARNLDDLRKIYKMTDFAKSKSYQSVPDPYYGGADGFELVLDILEDACQGLLNRIVRETQVESSAGQ